MDGQMNVNDWEIIKQIKNRMSFNSLYFELVCPHHQHSHDLHQLMIHPQKYNNNNQKKQQHDLYKILFLCVHKIMFSAIQFGLDFVQIKDD
jgi:predicted tellurium resistance membrane protein TerC